MRKHSCRQQLVKFSKIVPFILYKVSNASSASLQTKFLHHQELLKQLKIKHMVEKKHKHIKPLLIMTAQ